jgi:hypothetical protein
MNTNTTTPKESNVAKQETGEGWMGRLVRFLFGRDEQEKQPEDWTDGLAETIRDDPELRKEVQQRLKEEIEKRNARLATLDTMTNEQLTMIGVQYLLANALPFNEPTCDLIDAMQGRIIETNVRVVARRRRTDRAKRTRELVRR